MISFLAAAAGCSAKEPEIHFVLRNDLRGKFGVTEDKASGSGWINNNGTLVLELLNGSAARMTTLGPLRHWHRFTAEYEDGRNLTKYEAADGKDHSTEPQCYPLRTDSDGATWYFVGTLAELKAAH